MKSPDQETVLLEAVRKQYQKAEGEIREAADTLRRLVTASDQLDAARTTLGEANEGLREDGRSLLSATEALQRAVTSIESATVELAKADPARLAEVVESASSNLREQVGGSANALKVHTERTESWQQQVLVTLGQLTGQIRQDVRGELGPPMATVGRGVEAAASASAQGFAALSLAVEQAVSTSARDAAGIRSALVDAEAAHQKEMSSMRERYESESVAQARTLLAIQGRVLFEVRLVGGLILVGFLAVLGVVFRT